jgi:hypothetical protein
LTSGVDSNLAIIDQFPGVWIGTNAALNAEVATWGVNQNGMYGFATDTFLLWQWNGSQLKRAFPLGRLATTTNFSPATPYTNTSPTALITISSFTMPAGNRSLEIHGFVPYSYNVSGATFFTLMLDSTQLQQVEIQAGIIEHINIFATTVPSPGTHVVTLNINVDASAGSSAAVQASATQPIQLSADEV